MQPFTDLVTNFNGWEKLLASPAIHAFGGAVQMPVSTPRLYAVLKKLGFFLPSHGHG
jgi:hypothetical protein